MIRKITRNKQVTIPKIFLDRLQLSEGDYIHIDCDNGAIRLQPAPMETFDEKDYRKLAEKLDALRNEPGTSYDSTEGARRHLRKLMR